MQKRDEVESGVVEVETVFRDELATDAAVRDADEMDACKGDCANGDG